MHEFNDFIHLRQKKKHILSANCRNYIIIAPSLVIAVWFCSRWCLSKRRCTDPPPPSPAPCPVIREACAYLHAYNEQKQAYGSDFMGQRTGPWGGDTSKGSDWGRGVDDGGGVVGDIILKLENDDERKRGGFVKGGETRKKIKKENHLNVSIKSAFHYNFQFRTLFLYVYCILEKPPCQCWPVTVFKYKYFVMCLKYKLRIHLDFSIVFYKQKRVLKQVYDNFLTQLWCARHPPK